MPSGLVKTQLQFDFTTESLRHQLNLKAPLRIDNVERLDRLRAHRDEIDAVYGRPLAFEPMERSNECRVADYLRGALVKDEDRWDEYTAWFADAYGRMQRALSVISSLI